MSILFVWIYSSQAMLTYHQCCWTAGKQSFRAHRSVMDTSKICQSLSSAMDKMAILCMATQAGAAKFLAHDVAPSVGPEVDT